MPNHNNNNKKNNDYLMEKLQRLKKEKNAVILAHNYQLPEVQDAADYVGDSLELSQLAARVEEDVIVFCGVEFMAECAAVLAPGKTVLLPEPLAGCPLADMADEEKVRKIRMDMRFNPMPPKIVAYVNTSAAVKAESDVCVTSSNAVQVIKALKGAPVIFLPDKNLGYYVSEKTDSQIITWDGYCITHERVTAEDVDRAREAHPGAPVVVHPECIPAVQEKADLVLSTGGMVKEIARMTEDEIILGTETGMVHRLQKDNPGKKFYLLSPGLICPNMKFNNLSKVVNSLERMETVVTVPDITRRKAAAALQLMLELTGNT